MNISAVYCEGSKSVCVNCECIKGYAFNDAALWAKYALLPVICAGFSLIQDSCAHFCRSECLLPHVFA